MRPDGSEVMVLQSDPAVARQLLGWEATTSLEDGLRATIDWLRGRPAPNHDRAWL
jgi:UDP-glucose 4-epimerase